MRSFINKNGKVLAPILLVLACVVAFFFWRGGERPESGYFFDEDSGQEVVRPITDIPPLKGAKGNLSVVKEYKYSCDGGKSAKVGYYIKFTPEMQKSMEEARNHPDDSNLVPATGMLLRTPDSKPDAWVPATSAAGKKIQEISCDTGNPVTIYPN